MYIQNDLHMSGYATAEKAFKKIDKNFTCKHIMTITTISKWQVARGRQQLDSRAILHKQH